MVRAHDGISRGQGEVVILPWPGQQSTSFPGLSPTSRENLGTKLGRSFGHFVLSASSETQGQLQSSSKILKHFPNVDSGITVVSVFQNTRGSTLGRERAHYSENKSVRKVLHRLLSDILKREDDYIETPLIAEKVRLIVQ